MNENIKRHGREELKKLFENGSIPSQNDFGFLIDSAINKQDDGFSKSDEEGFIIAGSNEFNKLVSFYKTMDDLEPFFSMGVYQEKESSFVISPFIADSEANNSTAPVNTETTRPVAGEGIESKSFFFHPNGKLGIGKIADDKYKVDVNGFTASEGRIGTYKRGMVPADGKWHAIIANMDNCQAFEVIARTGKVGTGRFAILHAFAVSAFGGRAKSKIRKASSYYGFFWNRLHLKFTGTTHCYSLMMRTGRNYGQDINIYFNITKLWDDENFMPQGCYY